MHKKVSIIVRTKNEERWIGQCLSGIVNQNYKNIEIILVDNNSTDKTLEIALKFNIKYIIYKSDNDFKPGKAINLGVKASNGEYIVILSGHCIPTNETWLENLVANLEKKNVGGVYGRQEPLSFTSNLDKRDLAITFGLDKKIQCKDPFFHNANSAITREIWNKYPFDEECTNIEDRIWGKTIISDGYSIIYEPEASVFHYHGIHHGRNEERANKIVKIMETIADKSYPKNKNKNLEIAAFIPIKGELINYDNQFLLQKTIQKIKSISEINEIVVSTDNIFTADKAKSLGASKVIMRPNYLSKEFIGLSDVIKFTLEEYEKKFKKLDLVMFVEEIYPLRDLDEIKNMFSIMLNESYDSIISVRNESAGTWIKNDDKITPIIEQTFMPKVLKSESINIAQIGYCTFLRPNFIKFGDLLGPNILLYKIKKKINSIEVRSNKDMQDYLELFKNK